MKSEPRRSARASTGDEPDGYVYLRRARRPRAGVSRWTSTATAIHGLIHLGLNRHRRVAHVIKRYRNTTFEATGSVPFRMGIVFGAGGEARDLVRQAPVRRSVPCRPGPPPGRTVTISRSAGGTSWYGTRAAGVPCGSAPSQQGKPDDRPRPDAGARRGVRDPAGHPVRHRCAGAAVPRDQRGEPRSGNPPGRYHPDERPPDGQRLLQRR